MIRFVEKIWLKQKKRFEDRGGFSIIEVLVSIAIATLTLGSFATAVVLSFRGFEAGQEYYLATQIAQEGMELAISKRDNHTNCVISDNCPISNWQQNLIGTFEVDATKANKLAPTQTFDSFTSDNYLCVKNKGKYGYCGGDKLSENFTRKVTITSQGADTVQVETEVAWESRNGPKAIVFEEILFGPNN